jgi:hypothetical protein
MEFLEIVISSPSSLIFLLSATADIVRTIQLPSAADINSTGQIFSRSYSLFRLTETVRPSIETRAIPSTNLAMVLD